MCGPAVSRSEGPLGPSRRQLILAGAALPVLPLLPRPVGAVVLNGLDIQPRSAWGGDLKPKGALSEEAPGDVRFLLVHHTASPNTYAQGSVAGTLRGFYNFHTGEKGWPDIAYNFLVDRFGRVWEGRTGSLDGPVKGDATGGSQGFALLACFIGDHTTEPPSGPALDAMGKLLGALGRRHSLDLRPGAAATFTSRGSNRHPAGKKVTTPTIAGHRDMSQTSCPGDACYRLIPSRLAPAALSVAGVPAPPVTTPTTAAPLPAAPPTTLALPTSETLPATDTGAAPLDTIPAPAPTSPPPSFLGAAASADGGNDGGGGPVLAAGAAAAVAAAGLVALILRRRGTANETTHWEDARHLDEPH
ncbi:MAG: N-acetylmuramoyl-L-alanine amidase [Acidimicrobiales bacterium]